MPFIRATTFDGIIAYLTELTKYYNESKPHDKYYERVKINLMLIYFTQFIVDSVYVICKINGIKFIDKNNLKTGEFVKYAVRICILDDYTDDSHNAQRTSLIHLFNFRNACAHNFMYMIDAVEDVHIFKTNVIYDIIVKCLDELNVPKELSTSVCSIAKEVLDVKEVNRADNINKPKKPITIEDILASKINR